MLSRALKNLFEDSRYKGYGLPKWSRSLNHLAYVDDTLIFVSADKVSLGMVMKVLKDYQNISGQLINDDKSSIYMYKKMASSLMNEVRDITGFSQVQFPFLYLGCPITYARKKKSYYNDLIK